MNYYAMYSIGALLTGEGCLPVGEGGNPTEAVYDTLLYEASLFVDSDDEMDWRDLVGTVRIRRVLVSKIIKEGGNVAESMDQVDQLEQDICTAVWNEELRSYRYPEARCGDLILFQDLPLSDAV